MALVDDSSVWSIPIDHKHSGFPCRVDPCHVVFATQGETLDALLQAGKARQDHELAEHSYVHVSTFMASFNPFTGYSRKKTH